MTHDMWHPDLTTPDLSWSQVFFDGFTALPESRMTSSIIRSNKSFGSHDLRLRRFLRSPHRDHQIAVWLAVSHGKALVVKQVSYINGPLLGRMLSMYQYKPITVQEAEAQFRSLPTPGYTLQQVKQDMDPFVLEQRAYERISQQCSEAEKAFFPKYHGDAGDIQGMDRAIVLEQLRSSLRSRCLFSNTVPPSLEADLQLLRGDLDAFESEKCGDGAQRRLSILERKWCESLFVDRLKRLTTLHLIGVTHGDIKEDHFRLSDADFHDTALFDFSHAYTFTSDRPYMVQTCVIYSRFSNRMSTFRSMQKIVQMERDWVRKLICIRYASYFHLLSMIFERAFCFWC